MTSDYLFFHLFYYTGLIIWGIIFILLLIFLIISIPKKVKIFLTDLFYFPCICFIGSEKANNLYQGLLQARESVQKRIMYKLYVKVLKKKLNIQ